jgi:hypothetical protein
MSKVFKAVAVIGGAAALLATGGTGAHAASKIQIYRVYYKLAGHGQPHQLQPQRRVRDPEEHRLHQPVAAELDAARQVKPRLHLRDLTLGAKKYVTIHTGSGINSSTHRYWGSRAYIWNNTGDAAYLRTSSGAAADSCSWGSSGSSKYC